MNWMCRFVTISTHCASARQLPGDPARREWNGSNLIKIDFRNNLLFCRPGAPTGIVKYNTHSLPRLSMLYVRLGFSLYSSVLLSVWVCLAVHQLHWVLLCPSFCLTTHSLFLDSGWLGSPWDRLKPGTVCGLSLHWVSWTSSFFFLEERKGKQLNTTKHFKKEAV